jgi:hypothetical protein
VPLRVLDIDFEDQEEMADELVREHGDFDEDYLIPQVFIEYENGVVKHILTGCPEGVTVTKECWTQFLQSDFWTLRNRNMLPFRSSAKVICLPVVNTNGY